MNILLYGSCYPPVPYGASRDFVNLARALIRRGHEVTVVTASANGMPEREEREGIHIYRIAAADELGSRAAVARALAIAAASRCDLIQGVDYLGECAPFLRWRERPPLCIKVITSISLRVLRRSLAHFWWQRPLVGLACLRAGRQWRAEIACVRGADFLFAATNRVFAEFDRQGTRLPADRAVLPNPVEIPEPWANEEAAEPTMLYVGRLDFGKGVGYLPAILKQVRRRVPDVHLIIAGGDFAARGIGSVRAWLFRRFGEDASRVMFTGERTPEELDTLYRRAWLVVVPSRWDSCSNVTLEAMARAKAVIVSCHGGMSELVAGTGAPVVDPAAPEFGDTVAEWLADTPRRLQLGRALREKARECFHPDRAADCYCRFVASKLKRRALRPAGAVHV